MEKLKSYSIALFKRFQNIIASIVDILDKFVFAT